MYLKIFVYKAEHSSMGCGCFGKIDREFDPVFSFVLYHCVVLGILHVFLEWKHFFAFLEHALNN